MSLFDLNQTCETGYIENCEIWIFSGTCLLYYCIKSFKRVLMLYKKIKVWWFKKTGTSCKERFFYTDNPGKNYWKKFKKSSKIEQKQIKLIFATTKFVAALTKIYLWKGDSARGSVSAQFWYFPNTSYSFKTLSPILFGNSQQNSYRKFIILDVKSRFTFGDSNICKRVKLFPNIVFVIIANIELINTFSLTSFGSSGRNCDLSKFYFAINYKIKHERNVQGYYPQILSSLSKYKLVKAGKLKATYFSRNMNSSNNGWYCAKRAECAIFIVVPQIIDSWLSRF